ncbi:MAG: UTRA domain-containing protein [Blautia wexlerae]
MERLVWQDNEPIAIDKIYIEDARFRTSSRHFRKDRSFYQVMDECYHIRPNHSVLEIDGKAAQSHSADTLKCNVGDPLFSIHKISYDQDGKPIHYSPTRRSAVIASPVAFPQTTPRSWTRRSSRD